MDRTQLHPRLSVTWYDYFQLHLVYYIGQFQHIVVKFLVNRDSKVCNNWKGVVRLVGWLLSTTHVSTNQHHQTTSIQVQVMTSYFSKMPLKMTFDLENDLETQY